MISKPTRPDVEISVPTTSPRRKAFKSKAIISNESDDEMIEQPQEVIPRGTKRKRTIKMIAKGMSSSGPDGDKEPIPEQSTGRQAQACAVCHQQRQRCSWSGDNAACRSWGKRVKVDEDVYEGPAARVGERRRNEGTELAEQLSKIAEQNQDLVKLLQQSLVVQERMLGVMVRAERRVMEAMEGNDKGESEDEDED
ncbi:hypothetical protein GGU11DRAFT_827648, partial [Lentinula aff. detonsa]